MRDFALARVHLGARLVGVVAESEAGERIFEYDDAFRRSGPEISPLELPLSMPGPRAFPELVRTSTFEGLPGVLADSLPDRFGTRLIQAHFEREGLGRPVTPVQKLLYVGDRGPGALRYEPAEPRTPGAEEAIEVRTLVDQARRVVAGQTREAVAEIIRVGATAGGARPKAVVLLDPSTDRIRSGHARPEPGEEHWIIKFDGVTRSSSGVDNILTLEPSPWGRLEYAYARMAVEAGIRISETRLLHDGDLAHFMTRRFDRSGADPVERTHMHTLGGMLHLDYNDQYQLGYEEYFDVIRALGMGQPAIEEAFRRMVFAVATVNYDDHLKNHAFLMDDAGEWRLSPAYDLCFAENDAWTRQHQMSIAGAFRDLTREHLLRVGHAFDLDRSAAEIVDEVLEAVSSWDRHARDAGVPEDFRREIGRRLDREMAPLR
ncbi:MAG: type II toxin-antitoxin system HipA family toxin [Longimicrobiales bacterium]|nr:type II toxin-antitoxin system HipA family toxin [Longimicrobiales bacterium]